MEQFYEKEERPMKVSKRVLSPMPTAYAPCLTTAHGKRVLLMAPVDHGDCLSFFAPYDKPQLVWHDAGTMNIVAPSWCEDTIYSTRKFYPKFQAAESYVCRGVYQPDQDPCWSQTEMVQIPYLHRFNLVEIEGKHFFIGCSLSDHKSSYDDWSTPGSVYVADADAPAPWKPQRIFTGITKNHGYFYKVIDGVPTSLVSGVEGIFQIQMIGTDPAKWPVEKILDREVSDMTLFDLDGDGNLEMATIEGFHGDHIYVYRKIGGVWTSVYHCDAPHAHVVWSGMLAGERSLVVSHTDGERAIFRLKYVPGGDTFQMERETIDTGVGANNLLMFQEDGKDYIFAANWYIGESALYEVQP